MAKVHPTAVVDSAARLGDDVEIGPYCIVGPRGDAFGARTVLRAHVNIEGLTQLGADWPLCTRSPAWAVRRSMPATTATRPGSWLAHAP